MPQKKSTLLIAGFAVVHCCLFAWFSSYTAEDAFIVYRYSENLMHGNGLVFNSGEFVSALTSPLHALIVSVLYGITDSSLWANRLFVLVLHFSATCYALQAVKDLPGKILFGLIVWCSPFVIFWTAGGLETIYLSSFITIAFAAAVKCLKHHSTKHQWIFSICLGLAFLTRYDSCLVTLPIWFHVTFKQYQYFPKQFRHSLATLLLPGLLIACSWLVFSFNYYHDVFPTSVYHKPLQWDTQRAAVGYMIQFGLFCGILPTLGWFIVDQFSRNKSKLLSTAINTAKKHLGVLIGLSIFGCYASVTCLAHMMFSNRMLLPYLPAATLLLIDFLTRINHTSITVWRGGRFGSKSWPIVIVLAIAVQATLFYYIDQVSVNPGRYGEYTNLSRQSYITFIQTLDDQAAKISQHWRDSGKSGEPQIHVYAAGILPYKLPQAKIVDWGLVSYRKKVHVDMVQTGLLYSSDYIITLSPRHHRRRYQLQQEANALIVVDETTINFDGNFETLGVYFNPTPIAYRLPNYVDGEPRDRIPPKINEQDNASH